MRGKVARHLRRITRKYGENVLHDTPGTQIKYVKGQRKAYKAFKKMLSRGVLRGK